MKTVVVFGTFDGFHPGHHWFLQQAAKYGDQLIAVVSRDSFVLKWKGHDPIENESVRMAVLEKSHWVDKAILADLSMGSYDVLKEIMPDSICLGHDQHHLKKDLQHWLAGKKEIHAFIHVMKPWKRHRFSSTRRNKALRKK